MSSKYRSYSALSIEEVRAYQEDADFVLQSEMDATLDDIESRLNTILSLLDIQGISLIDEVKSELKELTKDLY